MHPHLRFPTISACLAGPALLFTASCSKEVSPPPKPAITLKSGEIRYRLHLFTTDENLNSSNTLPGVAHIAGIYSQKDGEKLLGQFRQNEAFHQDLSESAVGRKNQSVAISQTRDIRFATEYAPPVFQKPTDSNGSFPVTPATPITFETTELGTKASFKGRFSSNHLLSISMKLKKKAFLGMVNYGEPITTQATNFWGRPVEVVITENKIEVPVFRDSKIDTDITLQSGQFILVHGFSSNPPNIPAPKGYKPKPGHTFDKSMNGTEKANWLALIQVEAAP